MKVTDLRRKLAAALLAAGVFIPSTAVYAQIIPLGDASFEDFDVAPGGAGYAYAADCPECVVDPDPPLPGYRPTSAWIDDPDMAGQDDVDSNWLYDSSYDTGRRPMPQTGVNAMHGGGNYNGQETSALFEADKTYQFSVYTQGDSDADGATSRVWLYVYDGSVPFSEEDSLNFARYAPDTGDFVNRTPGSTQAQSQANWTQISLYHRVVPGAPEIGHPVGVAFWGAGDAAIDDAVLNVSDFNPTLDLSVDRNDGSLLLSNLTGASVNISGYQLTSAFEGLDPAGWVSITDNYDADSGGAVDGVNDWTELTQAGAHGDLSEADLESGSGGALAHNQSIILGNAGAWIRNPNEDLVLQYVSNGSIVKAMVNFVGLAPFDVGDVNTDGYIDTDDWFIVRANQHSTDLSGKSSEKSLAEAYRLGDLTGDRLNNHADFVEFKALYDGANGLGAFEAMIASVPEPSTILLLMTGGLFVLPALRRGRPTGIANQHFAEINN